jgi:hypothetical protein
VAIVTNPDTIEMLARRVRRWVAVEDLLFETLGEWARQFPEPEPRRVFGTWCHRHAWHAELWRDRLPAVDGLTGRDDVEAWIAPLRAALADVSSSAEAVAALGESVLPAVEAAIAEHRDAIDPVLDGPTARILDLVAADLTVEFVAVSAATSTA